MPELLATTRSARVARSIVAAVAFVIVVAGCGLAGPRATVTPVEIRTPAPLPSREASTHEAAIAAFVESVASGDLTYRVSYTGEMRMSTRTVDIKGAMTVVGEDFAAAWQYVFHDIPAHHLQVRGVAGKGYIKREGKAWAAMKGFGLDDSYVPFKLVHDVGDITYLGSEKIDGVMLHRLGVGKAMLIHPTTIPYSVRQEKIDLLALEVRIDDRGRPRIGTWELRAQARIGDGVGQLQRIVYELDLSFAKVGDKLTVKKP